MDYYPAGLDVVCWSGIILGAIALLATKGMVTGPRRGYVKLAGCLTVAMGALCGGTGGILFNQRAPHLTITGRVSQVVVHSGKGSSTRFLLTDEHGDGNPVDLHMDGAVRLAEGERAEVVYQAGSHYILELTVLDGRLSGYDKSEHDGTTGAALVVILGGIMGLYGFISWRNDRNAQPAADETPSPNGDVDDRSTLHLED